MVRHKLLPNLIGPGPEQDLQRLADELGRFPLEQGRTIGLHCNDEAGLVNRHRGPTPFKLGRGVAGWLGGSGPSGVERWFRQGGHGGTGSLVFA